MHLTYKIHYACSWYIHGANSHSCVSSCSQESDCVYWDKDKKTFGDFEVLVTSTDTSPTFIVRNMLIRHVKVTRQQPTL